MSIYSLKILCLYNNPCALELFDWIREQGHATILWNEKLEENWCAEQYFDLTVSYTYRYILSETLLKALGNNAVNLHTSYLPWNRGADPNMWSILEGTPRGVTLHFMNAGLDKGSIIAQELLPRAKSDDTLASTYEELDCLAKKLFKSAFSYYRYWSDMKKEVLANGSYHSLADGKKLKERIESYEMTVSEIKELNRILLSGFGGGISET